MPKMPFRKQKISMQSFINNKNKKLTAFKNRRRSVTPKSASKEKKYMNAITAATHYISTGQNARKSKFTKKEIKTALNLQKQSSSIIRRPNAIVPVNMSANPSPYSNFREHLEQISSESNSGYSSTRVKNMQTLNVGPSGYSVVNPYSVPISRSPNIWNRLDYTPQRESAV